MCILEMSKKDRLDNIYRKNYSINFNNLELEVSTCRYPKVKNILMQILNQDVEKREKYLEDFTKKISI